MSNTQSSTLARLLNDCAGPARAQTLLNQIFVAPALLEDYGNSVPRAVLAQAMNMSLFADLLERVPTAAQRVGDVVSESGRLRFDHGALRTVVSSKPLELPSGYRAFARLLKPLGFEVSATYPLPRIHMVGRSFTHEDYPEDIAQFFVSEIFLTDFSSEFQAAAERVIGTSRDPLPAEAQLSLARLSHDRALPYEEARVLLSQLLPCFERQHSAPTVADYEILLRESAEMAWISTEGNAFNHVTERVQDIESVAEAQKVLGRPMKKAVEVSGSGRVKQTAYFAATVEREFVAADGSLVKRAVPGSFYEFIERDRLPGSTALDLSFDSGNAQGIFKMTAVA
ncbi:2-oxoadipate dioxygenase/decarboxylase family protein [Steroidobacter sp.]|uniref:2-oxoadipate dioxygenase/decarboxylase family protein n=1 Tax=Steroidobacter sp. TaxID=1978227 RepID=UPI001A541F12|nr:DUF1338 family protein [Steroidobacter sp.]MBL8265170.1 DUF1338 family protein [Steroidobacter sp.]